MCMFLNKTIQILIISSCFAAFDDAFAEFQRLKWVTAWLLEYY